MKDKKLNLLIGDEQVDLLELFHEIWTKKIIILFLICVSGFIGWRYAISIQPSVSLELNYTVGTNAIPITEILIVANENISTELKKGKGINIITVSVNEGFEMEKFRHELFNLEKKVTNQLVVNAKKQIDILKKISCKDIKDSKKVIDSLFRSINVIHDLDQVNAKAISFKVGNIVYKSQEALIISLFSVLGFALSALYVVMSLLLKKRGTQFD